MLVDTATGAGSIEGVTVNARRVEEQGYDGLWMAETQRDPFLPLVIAAEHTERVTIGTSIAVAFSRNPMNLAHIGNDLQLYSGGRFVLGLGSQIKPHIERRFSMPWSHPAPRMREFISAMHAIWSAWNEGTTLDFRGDFYTHTLMTPFFAPPPNPHGPPKVFLAAVGEGMTRVAGEVTDGLLVHPFTTERYLRERTLPALREGMAKAGRTGDEVVLSLSGFVASATTEEGMAAARAGTKQQIAFYGSTPAYKPVLELHGWGGLADELNTLSRGDDPDRWVKMGTLVDDEVLDTFAIVAEPDAVAAEVGRRFGDLVHRFSFYTTYKVDFDVLPIVRALQQQPRPA